MNDDKNKRDKVILPQESDEDLVLNLSLRPVSIDEFIGQKQMLDNLRIAIEACKKRDGVLDHVIFSGPPGLGKTTLAHVIANEMGTKVTATSGPAIERAGDLIGILTNLSKGDILFIDEIHRLSRVVEEFLYPAMENFQIDFVIDKGPYAKTIKFNLKPFTLVASTTRSGLLTAPLRSRFGMFHYLDFYGIEDLVRIITRSANILGVGIDKEAAEEISSRSRGTPRIANRLLRRARDWAEVKSNGVIDREGAASSMDALGIDSMGLDKMDRKVLSTMINFYGGGPVGIESLAATLNEESDTIVDVVEPYLLKIGYIKRTPKGRVVTDSAFKHIGETKNRGTDLFS